MSAVSYIFYPGNNAQPVTLGDDAIGEHIAGGWPEFAPQTEVVKFAGAAYAKLLEHGNGIHSLTWRVDRYHGTVAAAALFKNTHPSSISTVPGIAAGVLQELLDDGTARFFQNCTRPKIKCVGWDGASTQFEYSVQFGRVTQTLNGNV